LKKGYRKYKRQDHSVTNVSQRFLKCSILNNVTTFQYQY